MSTQLVPTATQQVALQRKQERNAEITGIVSSIKDMGDPSLAMDVWILCQRKFKGKGGEYQLEPWQALAWAKFAKEEGLSTGGNETFFDPVNGKCGVTLEGKKRKSRDLGYNFGPPVFEKSVRPWPKGKIKIQGFEEDMAYTCSMEIVGFKAQARYTAWLSDWYVSSNPNWVAKTDHMLQVRAQEKAMSMSSGVGVSEQISEMQIAGPEVVESEPVPTIEVKEVEVKPI